MNNFSSGFLAIILAGFMAGKEVKLTGTLICQIKCNLSFSLANRRGLSLTSLPPFSLSFSLSLREVIHYCNLFAAENAKYLFNFEHSSIYLFAQSQFKQKSPRSTLLLPASPLDWVTFGRAYRLRLVGKIFNFLPELSERERKKQIRTKQTCPRDQNQSLQSAGGGNVDTRWQLELRLKLRLRLELVSGLLVSSVICTKIWLSIIDGGNNGNVKCTRQLLQLPACLPACLPTGHDSQSLFLLLCLLPLPQRGFYLKTILFALWICGA